MSTSHPLPCLVVAVSLASCGPAPVAEVPPAPPPAPPAPAVPTVVSPARWLERHLETLTPVASRKLPGGGGVLHASAAGERWITPEGPAPAPVGDAGADAPRFETASMILPERIVAILPVEQRWAFFGSSGRAFIAATPLGAIEEVRQPPSPMQAVSAGSGAAIAVTKGGDLLRTTDGGAHWTAVQAPGLSPAVPFAVALRGDGAGVLLAAPQRAFSTTDDGAGWAPLALPPGGPHVLEVSEQGEIWLARDGYQPDRTHRLEGKPPAFTAAKSPPKQAHQPKDRTVARYEQDSDTQRALAGKRVLSVGRPYASDPWKVEVTELDREGEWKAVPELEGCQGNSIAAAGSGDDFVLGCARKVERGAGAIVAADAGVTSPYRMVIYRSKDGGASWAEDGEVPIWNSWGKIVAGPDGWLLVQRRCKDDEHDCTPLAFRAAAGQPFSALEAPSEVSYNGFTIDAARRKLLGVSTGGKSKMAHLHTWSLDGHAGKATELPAGTGWVTGGLTVDEHGGVVLLTTTKEGLKRLRSSDEGATFEATSLPPELKPREVALTGDRGLLVDDTASYWETASAGKTWVRVTGLSKGGRRTLLCGRDGCASGVERRLGWDLATEAAPAPVVAAVPETKGPEHVPGATPMRCVASEPKAIPRALVDDLNELAATASAGGRLVVPAASKSDGIELVLVSTSEKGLVAKATPLFDAAPNRAAVGSHTDVMITSAGVVGSRSTYPVDAGGADVWISPVSAEVAWWRPQTGKVLRGRLPPLGKGHMRGTFALGPRSDASELFWLTPDGVVYRPDVARAKDLFTFSDKGSPGKMAAPALQSARATVRTSSGLTLLELPSSSSRAGVVRFGFAQDKGEEPKAVWTLAPPSSAPTILPLQRGDDGALVVAWSGPPDGPAHGFVVPVRAGDVPADITDLGLAALLVERPRACGEIVDPAAVRMQLTLPRAARRAILVEGGDKPLLVRADTVIVVVPPQGQACVSEWVAHGNDGAELAIIPVASPQRAWAVSATASDWQNGTRSRDLTVRPLRCEEAAGLAIPESFKWKGF